MSAFRIMEIRKNQKEFRQLISSVAHRSQGRRSFVDFFSVCSDSKIGTEEKICPIRWCESPTFSRSQIHPVFIH